MHCSKTFAAQLKMPQSQPKTLSVKNPDLEDFFNIQTLIKSSFERKYIESYRNYCLILTATSNPYFSVAINLNSWPTYY